MSKRNSKPDFTPLRGSKQHLDLIEQDYASFESGASQKLKQMPVRYHNLYKEALLGRSRKKAIRSFCCECVGYETGEVGRCACFHCPLWAYRE